MLTVRSLGKTYGETHALAGLDLDAAPGTILGVAGPNGAGKSTLIRVLAGEESADAGTVVFGDVDLLTSSDVKVAVVHQEPQLFANLTVDENLMVGNEGTRWRKPTTSSDVRAVLEDLELLDFRDRTLGTLPLAVQQRTEIARAIQRSASLFLFDEPNSALTEEESEHLFTWMHRIAARGAVVLFITHRLSELVSHADSVVVIRDGRVTGHLVDAFTQEDVARALVSDHSSTAADSGTNTLRVHDPQEAVRLTNWKSRRGRFTVPDVTLYRGEVTAVVGVEGSGGREFVASLAGYEPVVHDARLASETPRETDAQYLPASRRASLFHNLPLAQNTVARLGRGAISTRIGFLRKRQVGRLGEETRQEYSIASRSADQPVGSLSGGNQQKVAMAAMLAPRPGIVAVEEPTRGVDVGSRAEIHRVLREYARGGALVAVFCTEVSEVFEMADRVFVMDAGRLSDPLAVADYDGPSALAAEITALERHAR